MERSPWEANLFSVSQEIPRILWNSNVYYRIYKSALPLPILRQLDPVHTSTSHFLNLDFKLSYHLRLSLPSALFPLYFLTKSLYTPLPSPIRATCAAYLMLLDLITRKIFGEQYSSLSSTLCSFLHSPITSSLLGPNIPPSTLFSNTLSLRSFLNGNHQVSHPYKTTGNITFLYI